MVYTEEYTQCLHQAGNKSGTYVIQWNFDFTNCLIGAHRRFHQRITLIEKRLRLRLRLLGIQRKFNSKSLSRLHDGSVEELKFIYIDLTFWQWVNQSASRGEMVKLTHPFLINRNHLNLSLCVLSIFLQPLMVQDIFLQIVSIFFK